MIERQIDSPIPRPEGLVVKKAVKSWFTFFASMPIPKSATATSTRPASCCCDRNQQLARAVGDRCHGLDGVDYQIDDHLLQLDPIAKHRRQRRRELQPQRRSMPKGFALHQADRVIDHIVDVERRLSGSAFFESARILWMTSLARRHR